MGEDQGAFPRTEERVGLIVMAIAFALLCIFLAVYAYFYYKSRRAEEEAQRQLAATESTSTTAHAAGAQSQTREAEEADQAAASAVEISLLDYVTFRRPEGGSLSSPEKKKKKEECAMCLAAVEDGEVLCVLPMCHHEFHRECVERWLRTKKSSCPVCRAKVQWPCVLQSFAPLADDIV